MDMCEECLHTYEETDQWHWIQRFFSFLKVTPVRILKCKHDISGKIKVKANTLCYQGVMLVTWCSWQRMDLS